MAKQNRAKMISIQCRFYMKKTITFKNVEYDLENSTFSVQITNGNFFKGTRTQNRLLLTTISINRIINIRL